MKSDFIDLGYKKFLINKNSTILQAMKTIQNGEEGFCIVVDNNYNFINLITDGDLRRSIVNGSKISDKIHNVKNRIPIVLTDKNLFQDSLKKINSRINILPYVNNNGKIIGVLKKRTILDEINIRSKKITILGLGYVGLTLALILVENGFEVIGYDNNENVIKNLKKFKPLFYEKGIYSLLKKHLGHNLKVTNKPSDLKSDIYIISVGTPLKKNSHTPNISHIEKAVKLISKKISKGNLIIFRSTVPVGTTRNKSLPILEKNSHLKVGKDFYLSFCPERTVEGKALQELKKLPQIIGGYCQKSTELSMRLFNEYTHTVVDAESIEAAEFCKLIDNSYRDLIFAYSNELSIFAEKMNLNLPNIIDKVNLGYNRNSIPKPSPGVGGACLSKDPYLLNYSFNKINLKSTMSIQGRYINEKMCNNIYNRFLKYLKSAKIKREECKIFISGFAFKGDPETSDLRDSTTIDFLNILKRNNFKDIKGHDFQVSRKEILNLNIKYSSIEVGFTSSNIIFIMNNHKNYNDLNMIKLIKNMKKPSLIFDSWNVFGNFDLSGFSGIKYMGIGFNK